MGVTRKNFANVAVAGFTAALGLTAGYRGAAAQGQPAPAEIWKGVYTAEQAAKGEATYATTCARCHNPDLSGGAVGSNVAPPLGGEKFASRWELNNVDRLFHTIRDTMPRGSAGILTDDSALGLVAYILKYNGFPSGTAPLAPSGPLATFVFVPKDGVVAKREVGNFAQVETTGCLAEGPNQTWTLVSATDPVPARAGAFGVNASNATGVQLGSQTFRLVSIAPFRAQMQAGRAVQIKGLIRKDPAMTLINLTGLAATGTPCGT